MTDGNRKDIMNVAQIARVAHEANRSYCQSLGDESQVPWENAPQWQTDSAMAGVHTIAKDPDGVSPGDSHAGWMGQKKAEGWVYGPAKVEATKQHPCMVPFDELPKDQQAKDHIFVGIVRALLLVE